MYNAVAFWLSLTACGTPAAPPTTPVAPAPAPERAPAPSATLALSGTISFAGPPRGQAVFVSVKDPAHPGPPLAAKKLPPGPFPLAFTLTQADVMQMGPPRAIPATVTLSVTLDGDGDAMSKDPADPKVVVETAAAAVDLAITLPAAP
jgi:hypothetical protein